MPRHPHDAACRAVLIHAGVSTLIVSETPDHSSVRLAIEQPDGNGRGGIDFMEAFLDARALEALTSARYGFRLNSPDAEPPPQPEPDPMAEPARKATGSDLDDPAF